MSQQVIVVYSGGLDSTTLLYHLKAAGSELRALSVNYGQRHLVRELSAASTITSLLGIEHRTVDLRSLVGLLGSNSLTDHTVSVPAGEYSPTTIAVTAVPNRNMVLLSVAIAWAVSLRFEAVAFGAHGGEYTTYPDCQPAFAAAMDRAARVCHDTPIQVLAPFVLLDKARIVRRGAELGVPFDMTWSCYNGGEKHCGKCGTCIDRRSGFVKAGVTDPTIYEN